MPNPTLYIFTISHYCEKAKWALDHLGMEYTTEVLIPGEHASRAKKLGLKRGSVPFLKVGSEVIQGSGAIIDWGEIHSDKTLESNENADEIANIEKRLDDRLGVHIRRLFYSEALVEHPATVKPVFQDDLSFLKRIQLSLMWPTIRRLMIQGMDLGKNQGLESLEIVSDELDWLDGLLAGNKRYLIGNYFTRADLTAASLLAPFVQPKEHPKLQHLHLPPRLLKKVGEWRHRPSWNWVEQLYINHR